VLASSKVTCPKCVWSVVGSLYIVPSSSTIQRQDNGNPLFAFSLLLLPSLPSSFSSSSSFAHTQIGCTNQRPNCISPHHQALQASTATTRLPSPFTAQCTAQLRCAFVITLHPKSNAIIQSLACFVRLNSIPFHCVSVVQIFLPIAPRLLLQFDCCRASQNVF
jgi:hypothetical protein